MEDVPDAGFDNGEAGLAERKPSLDSFYRGTSGDHAEAYKGAQAGSFGKRLATMNHSEAHHGVPF